jgi:hypothetical protein
MSAGKLGPGAALCAFAVVAIVASAASTAAATDERQQLTDSVSAFARSLGFAIDPSAAIAASGMSGQLAGRLNATLTALLTCQSATQGALEGVSGADLAAALAGDTTGSWLEPTRFAGIRACFGPVSQALAELETHFRSRAAADEPPVSLDVWPILRIETGKADDTYLYDYVLSVDVAGNDTYANNAGSNVFDVKWGPGPPATNVGPSRGCQTALNGFRAGDCILTASALLDMSGDDTYGVFQTPDVDAACTKDQVVRRTSTAGSGLAGVGILRDVSGNDHYNGKSAAQGSGHIFGIGVLSDGAGDDSYLAVRNSQGFALLGGFGLLHDESGDDVYDYYMPQPIDPLKPNLNETPGAGGVVDDVGNCDKIPRFLQGAGNFAQGLGVLIDDQGDDYYRGALVPTFISSIGGGYPAGSLGFGAMEAMGVFRDRGGKDTYVGVPERDNGVTLDPGQPSTGTGSFTDE